jgi:uncharacterized protein YggE
MRKLSLITGLLILAATPALAQIAAPPPSPYDKAPWWMKESVITQTGYVFTELPANRASFSASFQTTDDTADKAQSRAIAQTKALMQALDGLGKDAVRVSTDFSMRTLYEQYRDKDGNLIDNERGDKIKGYQAILEVKVSVRDMAQLEKAYALVLAASPNSVEEVDFELQPDNATNSWLYSEAIKDAHNRAIQAAEAAGAKLGAVKVIDPTGRACETDILAAQKNNEDDNTMADRVEVTGMRKSVPPPVVQPRISPPLAAAVEPLEAKALQNPFIQTPPIERLESKACVVYALE